jgi:dTMP kinase
MLVAIAGIDGAGKSTLTAGLVNWLARRGRAVRSFKANLFHNSAYEHYRDTLDWLKQAQLDIEGELRSALITLEACHGIRAEIVPALQAGHIVICDRYIEGNSVYLRARNLPDQLLRTMSEQLPVANMSILLEVPVTESVRRLRAGGEQPTPEQIELFQRAAELYKAWADHIGALILDARLPADELVEHVGQMITAQQEKLSEKHRRAEN